MIRAVLSDWGHTLFDTAGSIDFIEQWAAEHGRPLSREHVERLYGDALERSRTPEELAKGRDKSAPAHRACWLSLWSGLEEEVPGIAVALYAWETGAPGWSPYIDTPEFLEALASRGIPLVIVSDVAFDLRPIFDHYGLRHLVQEFFISGEHATVKSEGALFRMALASVGAAPAEALMIGDNAANDGYAVSQGIRTLLLPAVASGEPRGLDVALNLLD